MKRKIVIHIFIFAALLLSACNLPTNNPNNQEDDESAEPTTTPTETPIPFTNTPEFTATPELTATPTIPIVSVSQNTNCRTGPGVEYDLTGGLNVQQTAEVIGKSTVTNYWIIKTPGGSGYCWLWGQYATVSGNTANLPEYPIPPTPTPSIPAAPQNFNASRTCVLEANPFLYNKVTVNLSWSDASNNEEGFRLYREGSLLTTLPANSAGYTDNTTLVAIFIVGNPPPSITYEIEAYNAAGASPKKSKTIDCQ